MRKTTNSRLNSPATGAARKTRPGSVVASTKPNGVRRLLKRVAQKETDDCGLACVAMLTGKTYNEVLDAFKKLPGKDKPSNFRTTHKQLDTILNLLGLETQRLPFKSWRNIEQNAIVKTGPKGSRNWHWVVFDAGRSDPAVLDPAQGKRELVRDFRRLKGSGEYIALKQEQV